MEVGCGCLQWSKVNCFQELYAALACGSFQNAYSNAFLSVVLEQQGVNAVIRRE